MSRNGIQDKTQFEQTNCDIVMHCILWGVDSNQRLFCVFNRQRSCNFDFNVERQGCS